MKKLFTLLITLALLLTSLVSCVEVNKPENETTNDEKTAVTLTNAMDLTAEWDKVTTPGSLVQGCVVVRKEFLEQHPDAVQKFMTEYEASINYLSTNTAEAAQMIEANGIFNKAAVAQKAIPNCNVTYLAGKDMKAAMQNYLSILHSINPQSVGGALPADDFYYNAMDFGTLIPHEDADPETAPSVVRIYTLNGTTGFGMAKLMNDAKNNTATQNYSVQVKTDASEVLTALINGDVDIAALPTNAAANVYNKTNGGVKILAVNTLGCLYLLTNQNATVTSFADLKGKTVYVPAQNPTFIFTYLCKQNGLEIGKDVIIDSTSYAQPANLRDAVASGVVDIAVLPEPMVTVAISAAAAAAQK